MKTVKGRNDAKREQGRGPQFTLFLCRTILFFTAHNCMHSKHKQATCKLQQTKILWITDFSVVITREGGPCGHEPRNIPFEPRQLAEPCRNPTESFLSPAEDCTKKLLLIMNCRKKKSKKGQDAGIGCILLLALR